MLEFVSAPSRQPTNKTKAAIVTAPQECGWSDMNGAVDPVELFADCCRRRLQLRTLAEIPGWNVRDQCSAEHPTCESILQEQAHQRTNKKNAGHVEHGYGHTNLLRPADGKCSKHAQRDDAAKEQNQTLNSQLPKLSRKVPLYSLARHTGYSPRPSQDCTGPGGR